MDPSTATQAIMQRPPLSEASLRTELQRLERGPSLAEAPKLRQLLRYLFEETLAGRADQISQYSIAFDCYGMGKEFDSSANTVIRSHARRLRKILADSAREDADCCIRMADRGYQLQLTSAGENLSKGPKTQRPSLGILEFETDDQSLFQNKILARNQVTAEIMFAMTAQDLVEVHELSLRDGAQARGASAAAEARRQNLDFLMDGSLHEDGTRTIFNVRLLDGFSGHQIWVGRGSVEMTPACSNWAHELARAIVARVLDDWGPIYQHISKTARARRLEQLTSFEAVILARQYLTHYHFEHLAQIVGTLRAAAHDTQDVAVPASLVWVLNAACGVEPRWREALDKNEIRNLAAQAARLDPEDPWARCALAFSAMLDGRRAELLEMAKRVSEEAESPPLMLGGLGTILVNQALDFELALGMLHRYCNQTSYYPRLVHLTLALETLARGDTAATRTELARFGVPWGWASPLLLAACASLDGDMDDARAEWQRVLQAFPEFESRWRETVATQWHESHLQRIFNALKLAGIAID
jgi:TolB-like protein